MSFLPPLALIIKQHRFHLIHYGVFNTNSQKALHIHARLSSFQTNRDSIRSPASPFALSYYIDHCKDFFSGNLLKHEFSLCARQAKAPKNSGFPFLLTNLSFFYTIDDKRNEVYHRTA
jgi:hypothetical protein